ncbi:MAG: hypothetical protein AAB650_00460 [Patescibacteria group bacterium]
MKWTRDTHLHSREHVLADDLSREMAEPKRFAAYLGIAKMYYESDLRAIAKRVAAKPDLDPKNRGKYFFGALRTLSRKASWLKELARRRRLKNRKRKHAGKKSNRTLAS